MLFLQSASTPLLHPRSEINERMIGTIDPDEADPRSQHQAEQNGDD